MNKQTLSLAITQAKRDNGITLICTTSWNGFEADKNYEAQHVHQHGRCSLAANDKDGIHTLITEAAAAFFDVSPATPLVELTEAEMLHNQRMAQSARLMAAYEAFTAVEEKPFSAGELVVWIPGLGNRRTPAHTTVMVITEVLSEPQSITSEPDHWDHAEKLDLRVGFMARSNSREDDSHMIEVSIDSRRVMRWSATSGEATAV